MTDQRKISLPDEGTGGKSSIERAAEGFDLSSFAPAPMPAELPPAPLNRLRKRQAAPETVAPPAEPEAEPTPAPVAEVPAEALPIVEPLAFAPPTSPADPAHEQAAQPIRFADSHAPIDRAHLRE